MDGPSTSQWRTAPKYAVSPRANATDDIVDNARERPDHPAFARLVDGAWRMVSSKEFADEVEALAAGLMAAGIVAGDRVALMSSTRYEWTLCDFAIWTAGAVTVPVYETSSPAQVSFILADSGAVAVFAETEQSAATVEQVRPPRLRQVWRMNADLDHLVAQGHSVPGDSVRRRRSAVTADAPATIVYTSGTTGVPKGCRLSHGNLVAAVRNIAGADGITETVLSENASILLFLPLAHILARIVALVAIHNGAQLAHTSDIRNLATHLRSYRPTLVLAVPRVFERLCNTARWTAESTGHGRLFRMAEKTAVAYSQSLDAHSPAPWLRARHRVFDRLVYGKLRAAMGGRVVHACSGGAPLGDRLGHFLRGAGITILEGWGLTETAAGVTLNLPAAQRIGTVGRPLPGCTVRIDPDGEVLVRGPNIFQGYWNNAPATAEVFDDDGWFHTGDLGELNDGYLTVTGRKKDIIITASGKNVAPSPLEDRLRAHCLVDQCLVVGDRRPYVGALLTLDPEFLAGWQKEHHRPRGMELAELRGDAELGAALQGAVDEANREVSAAEAIKRFRIVDGHFSIGAELTPTQKVRREYVLAKLAPDVEALYEASGSEV